MRTLKFKLGSVSQRRSDLNSYQKSLARRKTASEKPKKIKSFQRKSVSK